MIFKENLFEKNYSEIKDFQHKSICTYCLIEDNSNYGIEVDYLINNKNFNQRCSNISNNKNLVINILTYLYENSVPIETFDDVIAELLEKRKVAIN